jgi:hypothetical protein
MFSRIPLEEKFLNLEVKNSFGNAVVFVEDVMAKNFLKFSKCQNNCTYSKCVSFKT